ncbi:MAG: hypothetical protein DWH81_00140 [Planctomycetota bacterium]|nr:MAG: hypothetical protein DWH81_00140 [Planctomycetota bacterium]
MCFRYQRCIVASVLVVVFTTFQAAAGETDRQETTEASPRITIKLVDEEGQPVEGAYAGITAIHSTAEFLMIPLKDDDGWQYPQGAMSNAEGIVEFEEFPDGTKELVLNCVVARHRDRKLASIWKIEPEKIGRSKLPDTSSIVLHPACRVTGEITCSDLTSRSRETWWLDIQLTSAGNRAIEFSSFRPASFEFFLPPGEYVLQSHNQSCHAIKRTISVERLQKDLALETIDLPATKLALLEGMPAPDLTDVICWKNGTRVELSRLKGKVVVLDFWGYWCQPCLREMPELFNLYDKYQDEGLEIIGIHVDTGEFEETPVDSFQELDNRLKHVRNTLWGGRDIPFPVALVSGKRTSFGVGIETPDQARGELVAKYGVLGFPTLILLDRNGMVVGPFHPGKPEDIQRLQKLLKDK